MESAENTKKTSSEILIRRSVLVRLLDLELPANCGDADGNVAWWATAQLYKNGKNSSTKLVRNDGSDLNYPAEYLDFSENPQAINPPWKYVYYANNQPDSIAGMVYPGYYLPENRAKRIVNLL